MTARLFLAGVLALTTAAAANKSIERCDRAAEVLDEIMTASDRSIPQDLIARAECMAIVPGVKKGGFIFAGRYGKGVISCRGEGGEGWSGPSTVRIEGGSFGLQIGGSETDIILVVMNRRGVEKLVASKFTLGVDGSVAGGPVGRTAQAQTDAQMHAEILSYSRTRGVFAGLSLDGSTLRPDHKDNRRIYGRGVDPMEILNGNVAPPQTVAPLLKTLTKYSANKRQQ